MTEPYNLENKMHSKVRSKINIKSVSLGVIIFAFFLMPRFFFGNLYSAIEHYIEKDQWLETSGTVLSSRVGYSSSSCDSLRIQIEYSYFPNRDREALYKSNKYSLQDCWPVGEKAKKSLLKNYVPGSNVTIYVNKKDPQKAVIKLDYLPVIALALIPIFLLIPLSFATLYILRKFHFGKPHLEKIEFKPSAYFSTNDSKILAPTYPAKHILLAVIGSIFIVHFFFLSMVPIIYILPIELLVICYFALKTLSPTIDLELSTQDIHPGDEVSILIIPHGRTRLIENLKISLICREQTETGSGKHRTTHYHETYNTEVLKLEHLWNFSGDQFKLTIPNDIMPSIAIHGSQIQWFLHVQCHVKRLPSISKKYMFYISPKLSKES